jgi:hypothetical protein
MKPLRILHCPGIVGGNAPQLARAERQLGLDSWCVAFWQNYFQYKTDEVLFDPTDSLVTMEAKRWKFFWRALTQYDVIHFNFGRSILPGRIVAPAQTLRQRLNGLWWLQHTYAHLFELRDLAWLKRAGKGIFVTYQGDDARQSDYTRTHFAINMASEVDTDDHSDSSDQHKRWRIQQFARYADRMFALNPDLLHVLPPQAQFLPYSHIDLNEWHPLESKNSANTPPVVLHAPSHRGAKGTRYVLEAVSRLQAEGVPFEFILVEGLSNQAARTLYERADLLIDQLLAGWYGGLAVELMALGKPVMCYLREGDLKFIPEQMRRDLPIINVTPTTIYESLKEWLTLRNAELPALGQRSRAYVERWHDPQQIAARVKQEYEAVMAHKQPRRTA